MTRYYDFNSNQYTLNQAIIQETGYYDFRDHLQAHQQRILKRTPLHEAVVLCDFEEVDQLIKQGVDINAYDAHGNTALHLAYANHDTLSGVFDDIINLLKAAGADPHIINNYNQHAESLEKMDTIKRETIAMMFDLPVASNDAFN